MTNPLYKSKAWNNAAGKVINDMLLEQDRKKEIGVDSVARTEVSKKTNNLLYARVQEGVR